MDIAVLKIVFTIFNKKISVQKNDNAEIYRVLHLSPHSHRAGCY